MSIVKSSPTKRPLILFSGGLDSTFTLSQHLAAGVDVDVLYVTDAAMPIKIEKEMEVRKKIIDKCHEMWPARVRNQYVVSAVANHREDDKSKQSASWLFGALQVIDSEIHSEILISYIRGDGICTDIHKLEESWNSLTSVTSKNTVPIRFPLLTYNKYLIIHWWRKWKSPLLDMIWVCENPKKDKIGRISKCNACMPCVSWVMNNAGADHIAKHNLDW